MPIYNSQEIVTHLHEIPQKVISLVPSITETLLQFDLGDGLVGITDFCPPTEDVAIRPERIGGTKSPNLDRMLDLQPDLVIANQEENSPGAIHGLDDAGILVWLTFPKTADEVIEDLWATVRIFRRERHLAPQIETLQRSMDWTRLAVENKNRQRYFCPIWVGENADWWMTFNQNTYPHDILACCGGMNVFAERERRYPLEADLGLQPAIEINEGDTRYPRVTPSEVVAVEPDLILLPSEPYPFSKNDADRMKELLAETPAVIKGEIHFFDGRLITWHGIHLAEAILRLPAYFQEDIPR